MQAGRLGEIAIGKPPQRAERRREGIHRAGGMHKAPEIERLIGGVEQKGFTLVPLEIYFNKGRAKVAIALAKGKKNHDRREDIKRRIADREVARALKSHR